MNLKPFLFISLVANVLFVILKFTAAVFTGSVAMVSEGIHSVIDIINQVLLIWGVKASEKSPNFSRPLGYSKEIYFWSSIFSLTIFIIGGCASFYYGAMHFNQYYVETNQNLIYIILGIALIFNVFVLVSTIKRLNKRSAEMSIFDAAELNRDPSIFVILVSTIGDIMGIVTVFLCVYLGHLYQSTYYDATAALIIGVILFSLSFLFIRQCKRLLMNEVINPTMLRRIVNLAKTDNAVMDVRKYFTMYVAPKEALIVLETVFKNDLDSREVNDSIERIATTIKTRFPRVKMVHIDGAAA